MIIEGSISRLAVIGPAKWSAPPSFRSSRATAVITTCFKFIRRTASATRFGSAASSSNGFAVVTAQNPHARVQRSPAIMKVAVPWLQHSQRLGHCALSQTVCNRKSEISALVEKKTGFDGSRTLIQGGFCAWCSVGSIFAQDISNKSYNVKRVTKVKLPGTTLNSLRDPRSPHHIARTLSGNFGLPAGGTLPTIFGMTAILSHQVSNSTRIKSKKWVFLWKHPNFGSNSH